MTRQFLPLTVAEIKERGWDAVDVVCVTGDAYVDHPSFGIAIVSRVLESIGLRVAILAQPDIHSDRDFTKFGRPKLGFFVTSGNIDSMVSNYTAAKRKRHGDVYSPAGQGGRRPDRAVIVYSNRIRDIYPDIPIVIGGLEASLRRFAHYDYWDDAVRPSILVDSGADLLIYGMGEKQTAAIGRALQEGRRPHELTGLRGICYLTDTPPAIEGSVSCASFEKVAADKLSYAKAAKQQMDEQDYIYGRPIVQKHGQRFLVQTAPMEPLDQQELDAVFELPFVRTYHPSYEKLGGVPSIEEVEFSIMHNRGCFGHCNFCSIAFHQGRHVTCRSETSILKEAESFTKNPRFKGYIHDVGGPTANFRHPSCEKQKKLGLCKDRKCLAPSPCPALNADHSEYVSLLQKLRQIKGVRKVFVRSGIRFDYLLCDKDPAFLNELVEHHISGQLKVAPEHCSNAVLDAMGKPHIETYERFEKCFYEATRRAGKEQYLVPYLMSSHPGSTLKEAVELALFLKKHNIRPEQVQDFYPTPGTPSTCMFYTGYDPFTLKPVYVPKSPQEKAMQRALLQYFKPENRGLVLAALQKAGREDLIGNGKHCLIPHTKESFEAAKRRGKYTNSKTQNKVNKNDRKKSPRAAKSASRAPQRYQGGKAPRQSRGR